MNKKSFVAIFLLLILAFAGLATFKGWKKKTYGAYSQPREYTITRYDENSGTATLTNAYLWRLHFVTNNADPTADQFVVRSKDIYEYERQRNMVTLHFVPNTNSWTWDVKTPWYIRLAHTIGEVSLAAGILSLITAIAFLFEEKFVEN